VISDAAHHAGSGALRPHFLVVFFRVFGDVFHDLTEKLDVYFG
jgi:hypothetical protein